MGLAPYRKLVVALAGAASEAVAQGLISGVAAHYVAVALAMLTAIGVYVAPNAIRDTR